MNNNMPNNFNNGMSNNMNFNNDPAVREANEQLIGGQSSVGNGSDVMQGIQNVQNNPGIMQGFNNVQNPNGVMQGIENRIPDIDNSVPMPGQFNSGINSYTMQVERPQETPVSNEPIMPTVEPKVSSNDMNIPSFNNQQPMDINIGGIPTNNPVMPQTNMNNSNNIFEGLRTDNQVNESINSLNQDLNSTNNFDRPMVDVAIPSSSEINTISNEQPEMPLPQNENAFTSFTNTMPKEEPQNFSINQNMDMPTSDIANENINQSIPDINIPNTNEVNINNEVQSPNIQNSLNNELNIPNPFAMNNENLQANLNGQMNNEVNIPQTNIVDTPINPMPEVNPINVEQNDDINQMTMGGPVVSPIMDQPQVMDSVNINSQIGNTQDLNSFVNTPQQSEINSNIGQPIPQMNNNYQSVDIPQEKVSKFPLSLRETILVTIALIGIVAVVIKYWPK